MRRTVKSGLAMQLCVRCLIVIAVWHLPTALGWTESLSSNLRRSITSLSASRADVDAPMDRSYYTVLDEPSLPSVTASPSSGQSRITLTRYLQQAVKENPELRDLESLLSAVKMACKTIANLVNRAALVPSPPGTQDIGAVDPNDDPRRLSGSFWDGRYYSMTRLDQLSTLVLRNALKYTGKCNVMAPTAAVDTECPADHQPGVLIAQSLDPDDEHKRFVACLDPLDGSGNADASICTGTVFGVFEQDEKDASSDALKSILQPGKKMRAAGYCLYSSATVLVFTLGDHSVQGFTLDPVLQEFVLTHPNLTIPDRGTVYSVNEGNSEGWDDNFREYLRNLKTGKGETGQKYAQRYVGSAVGDIHRTLLYGGIFAYPSDMVNHPHGNLQLLYKSAPLGFILHHAGGRAIDGRTGDLLDVKPERVHQKSPCFMGSPDDVTELERYLSKKIS